MTLSKKDATRTVELLEQYQRRLNATEDAQLKSSIERVTKIFKSKLFNALLEIQETYEVTLHNENEAAEGIKDEEAAKIAADRWSKAQAAPPSHQPGAAKPKPSRQRQAPASDKQRQQQQPKQKERSKQEKQQQQQPDAAEPNDSFEIVLLRSATGFGFSIAGGTDDPRSPEDNSIYVTRIVPGGAAEADGRLQVDDTILAVNGVDTTAVSHTAAVTRLKLSGNQLRLLVRRDPRPPQQREQEQLQSYPQEELQQQQQQQQQQYYPEQQQQQQQYYQDQQQQQQQYYQDQQQQQQQYYPEQQQQQQQYYPEQQQQQQYYPEQQQQQYYQDQQQQQQQGFIQQEEVELMKVGGGLGFSIAGGVDNQHLVGDDSIFITSIIEGGAAQQDGRVNFGDRLLAVDGVSLIGVTHQQAVSVLKSTGAQVLLTLQKPTPEELQVLNSMEEDNWQQQQQEEALFPADAAEFQPMPLPKKGSKKDKKKKKQSAEPEGYYPEAEAQQQQQQQQKSKSGLGGLFGKKKK